MSKQKRSAKCICVVKGIRYPHLEGCNFTYRDNLNKAKQALNSKSLYKPSPVYVPGIGMVFKR